MDRAEGFTAKRLVASASFRSRRFFTRLKPGRVDEVSKSREAAKFFVKTFNDMTSASIDDCVKKLWLDYRRWEDVCSLIKLDPGSPHLSVLDLGGGLTTATRLFATSRKWVIDICVDEMREAGISLPRGIHFINGEAERIPFPDGFFSHIFCTNALDHFESPSNSLREMDRVLSEDGYCIISVDVFPSSSLGEDRGIKHPHTFSERKAIELISSAFEVMKVLYQPEGGKVGFTSLVQGHLEPSREKEEIVFVLQKKFGASLQPSNPPN